MAGTQQDVSVRHSMAHSMLSEHMLRRQLTSHKVLACQISRLSDLSLLSVVAHNSADEFAVHVTLVMETTIPLQSVGHMKYNRVYQVEVLLFAPDIVIDRADLPHSTNHDFTLSPAASSVERPSDVEQPYPLRGSNVSFPKYCCLQHIPDDGQLFLNVET